jgi:hypothetical protein
MIRKKEQLDIVVSFVVDRPILKEGCLLSFAFPQFGLAYRITLPILM